MTMLQFRTGTSNVAWAHGRSTARTGQGRGTAHLAEQIDSTYDRLPLLLPNPDTAPDDVVADYARYVGKHLDEETTDVLDALSDDYGLMWLTIARVAQVSVPALRKWRHGGNPTRANKLALARLLAACGALRELDVPDVAAWLSAPVHPDHNRQRYELLVLPEGGEALLALAQGKTSQVQALDLIDENWQDGYVRSETGVTFDSDGIGTVHIAD